MKMYRTIKLLFICKPEAVCCFSWFFSYLPSLSSKEFHADFKIFWHLFSILLLILSVFCLIDGLLDVGSSLQELSWHLQRRLSPADVNSGMWQGIPFQKSSVMPEMLVAINTVCIFIMKNWQVWCFKTHSYPKCYCVCWHTTKWVTWV